METYVIGGATVQVTRLACDPVINGVIFYEAAIHSTVKDKTYYAVDTNKVAAIELALDRFSVQA